MAAPSFISQTFTARSSSTSWAGTGPSALNVGDLLLALLVVDDTQLVATGSTTGSLPTIPTGWTEIQAGVAKTAGGDVSVYAFWRIADSADTTGLPQTYTWGLTGACAGSVNILRIAGTDTTTPINASSSATTAAGATSITLAAVTTTVADVMLLAFVGSDESGASAPYYADPMVSGWTAVYGSSSVPNTEGGSNTYAGIAYTTQASAGSSGTKVASVATLNDALAGFLIAIAPAAGGTTQTQSLSGSTTSAGALGRRPGKALAGTTSSAGTATRQPRKTLAGSGGSSGALARQPGKALAGAMPSAGVLTKQPAKALAGALASAGTLATVKAFLRTFTGSTASAGGLTRQTGKPLAGAMPSAGLLTKRTAKALAGTLTSSGTLARAKVALIALAGAMASAGTVTRRPAKALAGTLTSAGILSTAATFRRALAGATASSGAITRRPAKALAGTLTSSGAIARTKVAILVLSGAMGSAGGLARRTAKALAGALTSAGTVSTSTGGGTPVTGWSWSIRRGGAWRPATAKVDGHPTTTDVA